MTAAESGRARWVRYGPAVLVAVGAAVATAHGLYEVATAAKVPGPIAWLYPLVTDGLAMVAYSATGRLTGKSAGYAWTCVVLAAGLSGLAQAVYLAADTVQADPVVRFGVGAWPAIACALVAHLLHLILAADREHLQELGGRGEQDLQGHTAPTAGVVEAGPGQARVPSPAIAAVPAAAAGGAGPGDDLHLDNQDDGQDDGQGEGDGEERGEETAAAAAGDGRVRLLAELLAADCEVTGPQAAALLSHDSDVPVSHRTARRLLAAARQTAPTPAPAGPALPVPPGPGPRVHLHLLPTGTTSPDPISTSTSTTEGDPR